MSRLWKDSVVATSAIVCRHSWGQHLHAKQIWKGLASLTGLAAAAVLIGSTSEAERSPVFGVKLPPDYRDWRVISVAHEAGKLNDIRMVLGNDIAIKAYRRGTRPFPDGTMIARLAYQYVPSAQNNAVFGDEQSYVAGPPTNVQISVKDSRRFADTGGWGYGQFEGGKPNPSVALMQTCFACHTRLDKTTDLVFTAYAP